MINWIFFIKFSVSSAHFFIIYVGVYRCAMVNKLHTNTGPLCSVSPSTYSKFRTILLQMKKGLETTEVCFYQRTLKIPWDEHATKVSEEELKRDSRQNGTAETFETQNEKRRLGEFNTHTVHQRRNKCQKVIIAASVNEKTPIKKL